MSNTGHDNWSGYTVGESEGKWSHVDSGLMKYERRGTLVYGSPTSEAYRDGWERIFGKKEDPCVHCGGEIGPDISGRPMCYGCGPASYMPKERHSEHCYPWDDGIGPEWTKTWNCTCQKAFRKRNPDGTAGYYGQCSVCASIAMTPEDLAEHRATPEHQNADSVPSGAMAALIEASCSKTTSSNS